MNKFYTIIAFIFICSFAHAEVAPLLPLAKNSAKVYLKNKNNGTVDIRSLGVEPITFFLFDLDGNLVQEATVKEESKITIKGLKKGCYLYSILQKDESIGEGKLTIK